MNGRESVNVDHGDVTGSDMSPVDGTVVDTRSSVELLHLAQRGDRAALDRLCSRYLPSLTRWARGRLPSPARGLLETDDIVQDTVIRTLQNLDRFEHRRDGALLAYLRTALMNRVREEARRSGRRPRQVELGEEHPETRGRSALDQLVLDDEIERYEAALRRLKPLDREAIIARVEMGLPYEQVADLLGKPSLGATRNTVCRALTRLAEKLNDDAA